MDHPASFQHIPGTVTSRFHPPEHPALPIRYPTGPIAGIGARANNDRRACTRNGADAGNAVAIVLLVLGVVSLLGVGLLTRSTMDTRFSAAYKSHERLFSLADGAANIAFMWLAQHGAVPDVYVPNQPNQQPLQLTSEYQNPFYVRKPDPVKGSRPEGSAVATCPPEGEKGMYWPVMSFLGIGRPPAGFEIPKFESQFWIAGGLVTTERTKNPNPTVQHSSPRAQASVQVAVQKTVKKQ